MIDGHASRVEKRTKIHAEAASAKKQGTDGLLKDKGGDFFIAGSGGGKPTDGDGGFSAAGRTDNECTGATIQPSAYQGVEIGKATAGGLLRLIGQNVFGRDETRKNA